MTTTDTTNTPAKAISTFRAKAKMPPETAAKKKLLDDLAASEKTYMDLANILAAYPVQYAALTGDRLKIARVQHDETMSAIDDDDEVRKELKTAIQELRDDYETQKKAILSDAASAETALDETRSPLGVAEASVAVAQADLDRSIGFPARATAWFDDVAVLGQSVKESAAAGNARLAYAQFIELDDVYHTLILAHFGENADSGSPDWLRAKLNTLVLALVNAQYARFQIASTAEAAAAMAIATTEVVKTFVVENGCRVAFFRESQDIVVSPGSEETDGHDTKQEQLPEQVPA